MKKELSLEQAMEAVTVLIMTMKTVVGFRISQEMNGKVNRAADLVEAGKNSEAVVLCKEIVSAGRSILGAFLRNSVFDKLPKMEGEEVQEAHFRKEIRLRTEDNYHEDLVARMVKFMGELEEAVRQETNGDFSKRVEAYNAMQRVLDETWKEQIDRDNRQALEAKMAKKAKASKRDAGNSEAQASSAAAQREKAIQARVQMAKSLRAAL